MQAIFEESLIGKDQPSMSLHSALVVIDDKARVHGEFGVRRFAEGAVARIGDDSAEFIGKGNATMEAMFALARILLR